MKKQIFCLLALFGLLSFSATFCAAQGLSERRAIKEFQDNKFPELKKALDAAAGFDVKVTVNWDKLALPGQSASYNQDTFIADIFFYPLVEALKQVSKDEMGKTALKTSLKEVVMTYDATTAPISNYESGWPFENGVLTINYQPGVNSGGRDDSNYKERVDSLVKILEAKM